MCRMCPPGGKAPGVLLGLVLVENNDSHRGYDYKFQEDDVGTSRGGCGGEFLIKNNRN